MENLNLLQQFLLAVGGICLLLACAMAIGKATKDKNDKWPDGMA